MNLSREAFTDRLMGKFKDTYIKSSWDIAAVEYGVQSIRDCTKHIAEVHEESDGYLIEFLIGTHVPENCAALYTIWTYLKVPCYARMNGMEIRIETR